MPSLGSTIPRWNRYSTEYWQETWLNVIFEDTVVIVGNAN